MALKKYLLGFNNGHIRENVYIDHESGGMVLETVGDVAPIIADAKGRFNMVDERARWRDGYNHVAHVPLQVIDKVRRETGLNLLRDMDAAAEFLNNKDQEAFRTRPGRVSHRGTKGHG